MNLLLNSIKKGFWKISYGSDTVTVNYKGLTPQQSSNTIVNNQNMSRKEPSQLWVIAKLTGGKLSESGNQNFPRNSSTAQSVYRSTNWR